MLFFYISKNATKDLVYYYGQFSLSQSWFEPGWGYFTMFLSKALLGNPHLVHFALQFLSILLIFFLAKKFFAKYAVPRSNYYFLIPAMSIIIYTMFYFLGSQNVLRQFFSSILCLYAFYFGQQKKWFLSFVFYLISMTFHFASSIMIPFFFILSLINNQKIINYALSFIGGVILLLLMLSIFREHPAVEAYFTIQDKPEYKERSTYFKFIVLSISLFFTHFIFTRTLEFKFDVIKKFLEFRIAIYCFALPFASYELWTLWTRITLVTYFIELFLTLLIVFSKTSQKYRFGCALLIMSYGIAPNVKNILYSSAIY